jgi:hypothetical protein
VSVSFKANFPAPLPPPDNHYGNQRTNFSRRNFGALASLPRLSNRHINERAKDTAGFDHKSATPLNVAINSLK